MSRPTPPEHSAAVIEAARWLYDKPALHGIVPSLRKRFGLTTPQAVEAIRMAAEMRRASS